MITHRTLVACSFLAATCLSLIATPVDACRCRPPGAPEAEKEKSIGVFAGTVIATKVEGQHLIASVAVSQSWKGSPAKEVTVRTASNGARCGFGFQEGQEYLIYCSGEKDGVWATHLCTRTRTLERATEDLDALGPGEMPK